MFTNNDKDNQVREYHNSRNFHCRENFVGWLSSLEETLDSQFLPVIKTSNSAQSSRQPCLYFATSSVGMDSRIPKVIYPQLLCSAAIAQANKEVQKAISSSKEKKRGPYVQ